MLRSSLLPVAVLLSAIVRTRQCSIISIDESGGTPGDCLVERSFGISNYGRGKRLQPRHQKSAEKFLLQRYDSSYFIQISRYLSLPLLEGQEGHELQLNGKSYGVKSSVFPQPGAVHQYDDILPIGTTKDLHLTWDVPFEPGVLRVIGRQNGQIVAQEEIRTAGTPATIALKLDKTTLESATRGVAQIEVRVLDANGILVPNASNTITFDVQGPAKIIGVDNGDPISHDSYKANHRPVFNGMALITLQAAKTPGRVTLTAKAESLQAATVELEVQSGASIPTLP